MIDYEERILEGTDRYKAYIIQLHNAKSNILSLPYANDMFSKEPLLSIRVSTNEPTPEPYVQVPKTDRGEFQFIKKLFNGICDDVVQDESSNSSTNHAVAVAIRRYFKGFAIHDSGYDSKIAHIGGDEGFSVNGQQMIGTSLVTRDQSRMDKTTRAHDRLFTEK
jgi:hypothetical protein